MTDANTFDTSIIKNIMTGLTPEIRLNEDGEREIYMVQKPNATTEQIENATIAFKKLVTKELDPSGSIYTGDTFAVETLNRMGQPEMYRGKDLAAKNIIKNIANTMREEKYKEDMGIIFSVYTPLVNDNNVAFYKLSEHKINNNNAEQAIHLLKYYFGDKTNSNQEKNIIPSFFSVPTQHIEKAVKMIELTKPANQLNKNINKVNVVQNQTPQVVHQNETQFLGISPEMSAQLDRAYEEFQAAQKIQYDKQIKAISTAYDISVTEREGTYFRPKDGATAEELMAGENALRQLTETKMKDKRLSSDNTIISMGGINSPKMFRALGEDAKNVFAEIAEEVKTTAQENQTTLNQEQVADPVSHTNEVTTPEFKGESVIQPETSDNITTSIDTKIETTPLTTEEKAWNQAIKIAAELEKNFIITGGKLQAQPWVLQDQIETIKQHAAPILETKEIVENGRIIGLEPINPEEMDIMLPMIVAAKSTREILNKSPEIGNNLEAVLKIFNEQIAKQANTENDDEEPSITNINGTIVEHNIDPTLLVDLNEPSQPMPSNNTELNIDDDTYSSDSTLDEDVANFVKNHDKASTEDIFNFIKYNALKNSGNLPKNISFNTLKKANAKKILDDILDTVPDEKTDRVQDALNNAAQVTMPIISTAQLVKMYTELEGKKQDPEVDWKKDVVTQQMDTIIADYITGNTIIDQDNIADVYDDMIQMLNLYKGTDRNASIARIRLNQEIALYDKNNNLSSISAKDDQLSQRFDQVQALLKDVKFAPYYKKIKFTNDEGNVVNNDTAEKSIQLLKNIVKTVLLIETTLSKDELTPESINTRANELLEINTTALIASDLKFQGKDPKQATDIVDSLKKEQTYEMPRKALVGFTTVTVNKQTGLAKRLATNFGNKADIVNKVSKAVKNLEGQKQTNLGKACLTKFGLGSMGGAWVSGAGLGAVALALPVMPVIAGAVAAYVGGLMWWQRKKEVEKAKEDGKEPQPLKSFFKRNTTQILLSSASIGAIAMGLPAVALGIGAISAGINFKSIFKRNKDEGYSTAASTARSLPESVSAFIGSASTGGLLYATIGSSMSNTIASETSTQQTATETGQEISESTPVTDTPTDTSTDAGTSTDSGDTGSGTVQPQPEPINADKIQLTLEDIAQQSEAIYFNPNPEGSITLQNQPVDINPVNLNTAEPITATSEMIQHALEANHENPNVTAPDLTPKQQEALINDDYAEELSVEEMIVSDAIAGGERVPSPVDANGLPSFEYQEWLTSKLKQNPELLAQHNAENGANPLFPDNYGYENIQDPSTIATNGTIMEVDSDTGAVYLEMQAPNYASGNEITTNSMELNPNTENGNYEEAVPMSETSNNPTVTYDIQVQATTFENPQVAHTYDDFAHKLAQARLNGEGVYDAQGRLTEPDYTTGQLDNALKQIRSLEGTHSELTGANGTSNADILMYKLNQFDKLVASDTDLIIDGNRTTVAEAFGIILADGRIYTPTDLRADLFLGQPPITSDQIVQMLGKIETAVDTSGHFIHDIAGLNEARYMSYRPGADAGFKIETVVPKVTEPAPAPVAEQPTPVVEEPAPAPVAEQPTPAVEEPAPAPVAEQPTPVVEEPAPAPVAEQPTPAVEEPAPAPVAEQPTPVVEEPAPAPVPEQAVENQSESHPYVPFVPYEKSEKQLSNNTSVKDLDTPIEKTEEKVSLVTPEEHVSFAFTNTKETPVVTHNSSSTPYTTDNVFNFDMSKPVEKTEQITNQKEEKLASDKELREEYQKLTMALEQLKQQMEDRGISLTDQTDIKEENTQVENVAITSELAPDIAQENPLQEEANEIRAPIVPEQIEPLPEETEEQTKSEQTPLTEQEKQAVDSIVNTSNVSNGIEAEIKKDMLQALENPKNTSKNICGALLGLAGSRLSFLKKSDTKQPINTPKDTKDKQAFYKPLFTKKGHNN